MRNAIVLFLLLVSVSLYAQESYSLKYNFEKGKVYYYNGILNGQTVQSMQGRELAMDVKSRLKYKVEIPNISSGEFEIISSLDSGVFSLTVPDMETRNDYLEKRIGKKTKHVSTKNGNIISVTFIDVMEDQKTENQKSLPFIIKLPVNPVKAGDSWTEGPATDSTDANNTGKIVTTIASSYKFEGKEKYKGIECLKISFSTNSKTKSKMMTQETEFQEEREDKTTGYFYFDYSKGLILNIESDIKSTSTRVVESMGMVIPVTAAFKSSMVLLN